MLRLLCGGGNNEGDTLGELDGTPIISSQNLLQNVVGIWSGTKVVFVNGGGDALLWTAAQWKQQFGESDAGLSAIILKNGDPGAMAHGYCSTYINSAGSVGMFTDSSAGSGGQVRVNFTVVGIRS